MRKMVCLCSASDDSGDASERGKRKDRLTGLAGRWVVGAERAQRNGVT